MKARFKTHGQDVDGEEKIATNGKINRLVSDKNLKKKKKNKEEDNHKENHLSVEPARKKK